MFISVLDTAMCEIKRWNSFEIVSK